MLLSVSLFFHFFLKGAVNTIDPRANMELSEEAKNLHNGLLISDMHADSLLYDNSLLTESNIGQLDIPRLLSGNVSLQVFSAVTKFPVGGNIASNDSRSDLVTLLAILQGWPYRTWGSLMGRAVYQAEKLKLTQAQSKGTLKIIYNRGDLYNFFNLKKNNRNIVGGLLEIEGGQALEGNIDNLEILFNEGYRIMSLTHFFDNELGGSIHGLEKNGITSFGKEAVFKMEQHGMIVDLAHASEKLIDDVLKYAKRPVIVSHTGVKSVCNNNRNLSDEYIVKIAGKGGIIGIGFWDIAMGECNVNAIAKSIRHIADLAGIEHVGLGSDFDGAVKTPIDASQMPQITEALLKEGFSNEEITLVMGENFIKFLENNLPD